VPADAAGSVATNTTGPVTGTLGGLPVSGASASDELELVVHSLRFDKAFSGAAFPGDSVALTFTVENQSDTVEAIGLAFADDLDATLPGLAATGLPAFGVCGEGSVLEGTSFLTLTDGSLLPRGSCSFSVDLAVPASAAAGDYLNITSELEEAGLPVAPPATDTLVVLAANPDEDDDGILNEDDACPDTGIPEDVPTVRLGTNRFALMDGDAVFDTSPPNGRGPDAVFTLVDTAGCSCGQIVAALGLGKGHEKFGCSLGAMRTWENSVNR
jgi:hypothetical protein